MAKYTEAFCVTTGSMISIMQMRSEYNHDPAIYEKVYKGHLFCPGCQAVPLTVVHTNGQLYYRGHPHEEHADGCWYALDERVVKSVTEINGDSEEQALSQLDSLLRATFNGNQQAANARAANRNANRSNAPVVHQQQEARRRLPQCRIEDLPVRLATNDRPQEISIYYGKVLCKIVNAKNPYNGVDIKVLILTPPTIEIVGFLGGSCKAHHHAACQAASYAVSHKKPRVWLSMSIQPLQVDQHTCLRSQLFECILLWSFTPYGAAL